MKGDITRENIFLWLLLPSVLTTKISSASSAIASEVENHNVKNYEILNSQIDSTTKPVFEQLYNGQNPAFLSQSLKNLTPSVETEALPEFTISDVIPIEEFKIKPPKLPSQDDNEPEADLTKPPVTNKPQIKPYTESQKILIQKLRQSKIKENIQQKIILYSLTSSANKYPWIVNPTDNLTFSPQQFKPDKNENYINTDLNFQSSEDNLIVNKFTFGIFPKNDQFYWLLNNNRLVFETQGLQAGIFYQGKTNESSFIQTMRSNQGFWGLQYIVNLPVDFKDLIGGVTTNNDFSIVSIAGQLINPEGIPAGQVVINSGVNLQDPNVTVLKNTVPVIGSGSTLSPDGGQALFQALEASNSPQILQAYPTTNLKPILDGGNVQLKKGEIIPNSALEAAGIFWGDPLTGEGFGFKAPVSSAPGIKIAQPSKFDNYDLLNIAVNPFLTPLDRDLHYLNSLFWISLGKRTPIVKTLSDTEKTYDWQRLYVNVPHNRSIVQYDADKISATYSNIFSSPGLSITANFADATIDSTQTANSTLGLALGGIFEAITIDNIDQSLAAAREQSKKGEGFSPLTTKATPDQRRQINNRLNRTLAYANSNSGLEQVSGTFTVPSEITPNDSNIFQIRTGIYKRSVQFLQRDAKILQAGDTFFSDLKLSNKKFGPLSFIGVQIPLNDTAITPINEASGAQVILTNSDGKKFVQQFSSADNTIAPVQVRTFDLAFDYFELSRVDIIDLSFKSFNGSLFLPSVELLAAGTVGDFNYSVGLGTWFNIDAKSAPGVNNNNLGLAESSLGIYSKILLNYIKTDVELDLAKRPVAVNTHVPSLRVDWNSESNRINPFSTILSYYFNHQERYLSFSLSPAVAFIENNGNGEFLGLFNGDFTTSTGFNISTSLELGKDIYYQFQSLQKLDQHFSVGAYVKNYSTVNLGLSSRVEGLNYGGIFRYNLPDSNLVLDAQIGTGENGFDVRIQGSYSF
ncbi:MAG: hypothetical protein ACFKPT_31645 [Gloeotrichia echinulata GP01]